jgi:hypothetical protein
MASFPLPDGCPIGRIAVWRNVLNLQCDDIAGAELAIDCQIEHGEVAGSSLGLKLAPYQPNMLRAKGRLGACKFPLVPGRAFC